MEEVCDRRPVERNGEGRGAVEGNGKVRDKRLENGIGHGRAHDFLRVVRCMEGGARGGGGGGSVGAL